MIWKISCDHILSCCLENHFRKNKERCQQGGGAQLVPIGSPMTCRKRYPPNFTKMLSIKNSTTLHIWFALYVLSPLESVELLKYPLLPSTLVYVYLINTPFLFLKGVSYFLVSKHDSSFVVHLLEPAVKRCLNGVLCSFGVQCK